MKQLLTKQFLSYLLILVEEKRNAIISNYLNKTQYLSRNKLTEYQIERLNKLLTMFK